jgi:hypothetical protein
VKGHRLRLFLFLFFFFFLFGLFLESDAAILGKAGVSTWELVTGPADMILSLSGGGVGKFCSCPCTMCLVLFPREVMIMLTAHRQDA